MHPFLDIKKLTDEQIIEKLGKAYSYMDYQVALGHTPTVESIKEVIRSLEDERRDRTNRQMDEEYKKKYPDANSPIDVGIVDKIENLEDFIRKAL